MSERNPIRLAPPREHEVFDVRLADLEAFKAATEDRLRRLETAVAEHEMKLRYIGEQIGSVFLWYGDAC